jgi:hypothetical protein
LSKGGSDECESGWLGLGLTRNRTTQVYYSTNQAPLVSTGKAVTNSVSGQGEYHFGILKKPIGGGSDIPHNGYQPSNINEGVIFGGIFQEDSKNSCVSLKP